MKSKNDLLDVKGIRILRDAYLHLGDLLERYPDYADLVNPVRRKIKAKLKAKDWSFFSEVVKKNKSFLSFPNFNRFQVLEIKEKWILVRTEHSGTEIEIPHQCLVSDSDTQTLIKKAKKRLVKASVSKRKKALAEKREQREKKAKDPTQRMIRGQSLSEEEDD